MDEADKLVLEYLGEEPVSGIPGLKATNVIPNENSIPKKENANVPVQKQPPTRLQKIINKYSVNKSPMPSSESETEPLYANPDSLSDDSCVLSQSQTNGSSSDEPLSNSFSTYSPPSSPSADFG